MSAIQNAGQQRYYDFISERAKSIRTGMIVWISLLCVAFISLFNNPVIAAVLALAGAFLAVMNLKSQRALKEKLSVVPDQEEFFRQLTAPGVVTADNGHVLAAADYVLVYRTDVFIYPLADMEKIEVGFQGKTKKFLFLTDKNGERHEIMSCMQKAGESGEFDRVYYALKKRLDS